MTRETRSTDGAGDAAGAPTSWESLFRRAPDDVTETAIREVLADHRRTSTRS